VNVAKSQTLMDNFKGLFIQISADQKIDPCFVVQYHIFQIHFSTKVIIMICLWKV